MIRYIKQYEEAIKLFPFISAFAFAFVYAFAFVFHDYVPTNLT